MNLARRQWRWTSCWTILWLVSACLGQIITLQDKATLLGRRGSTIDSWLGIRYADWDRFGASRPTKQHAKLRLPNGTWDATTLGPRCPQPGSDASAISEDCLVLNIYRPSLAPLTSAAAFTSEADDNEGRKLPVILFFHGGGFRVGSANDFDPTVFLESAQKSNRSAAVFVAANYRLGLLGFLASSSLQASRDANEDNVILNPAMQDQRVAIQWVRDNIKAFGGDSDRITLWGQSAGAFGVGAQLLAHANDAHRPFHAVILQSGGPAGVALGPVSAKDDQFQRILSSTNCANVTCLRVLPLATILAAQYAEESKPKNFDFLGGAPWTACIDGGPGKGGFYEQDPIFLVEEGKFASVPILIGDTLDEGTLFTSQSRFGKSSDIEDWIDSYGLGRKNTDTVMKAYPNDPTQGSPYGSTQSLSGQYKRAASIWGDIRFQSTRRLLLAKASAKAWTYQFSQSQSLGTKASLGVPHSSDLYTVLEIAPTALGSLMANQFVAFAANGTPEAPGLPPWPAFDKDIRTMLQYIDDSGTLINDTYRDAPMETLIQVRLAVQTDQAAPQSSAMSLFWASVTTLIALGLGSL